MILKTSILLTIVVYCDCVYVYSSFWAPLYDPRVLGYRVDASFDHDSGKNSRGAFQSRYGNRGENLVADLGNGKGPSDVPRDNKVLGDVRFYYTHGGAHYNQPL